MLIWSKSWVQFLALHFAFTSCSMKYEESFLPWDFEINFLTPPKYLFLQLLFLFLHQPLPNDGKLFRINIRQDSRCSPLNESAFSGQNRNFWWFSNSVQTPPWRFVSQPGQLFSSLTPPVRSIAGDKSCNNLGVWIYLRTYCWAIFRIKIQHSHYLGWISSQFSGHICFCCCYSRLFQLIQHTRNTLECIP